MTSEEYAKKIGECLLAIDHGTITTLGVMVKHIAPEKYNSIIKSVASINEAMCITRDFLSDLKKEEEDYQMAINMI